MTRREQILLATAALGTFALRAANIGALPIFNDEAIYLRWAQLIGRHPQLAFSIPLEDPKPPLHYALLALVTGIGSDPLVAARLLSALAGALSVVFAVLIVRELGGSRRAQSAAAVLFAFCPWLAFHQRLAAADALFVAEATAVVWLSLRGKWIPVGVVMGAAMLTRQIVSYALWALPLVTLRKRVLPALVLAIAIWSPYLTADLGRYGGDASSELRRRVLYKQEFRQPFSIEQVNKNATSVHQWLWTYLTPPLYAAAAIAVLLAWRRRLLLLWLAITLLPLIAFGAVTWPRYGLSAVPPLLLMVALAIDRIPRFGVAALVVVALSVWPARDTVRQITDWQTQTLVPADRWQHVSGWPAGYATERAIAYLQRQGPSTIVTGAEWGLPADAVWAVLDGRPGTTLRWEDDANPGYRDSKWLPSSSIEPLPDGPVFRIHRGEPQLTFEYLSRLEFTNPGGGDKVTLFRVR